MILIISHRRSGTHLLIDAIRANYKDVEDHYISIKELLNKSENIYEVLEKIKLAQEGSNKHVIIKCHFPKANLKSEYKRLLEALLSFPKCKAIYLWRDPRDVMISLSKCPPYNEVKNFKELIEFSQQQSQNEFVKTHYSNYHFWRNLHESWSNPETKLLIITFYSLKNNYIESIESISKYLELRISTRVKDVRIDVNGKIKGFRYTTVEYNGSIENNNIWHKYGDQFNQIFERSKSSLKQDEIILTAGIIPLWSDQNSIKTIMLFNSDTLLWDFPKGIKKKEENVFVTALREYSEETSLKAPNCYKNILSPSIYSYSLNDFEVKKVILFPLLEKINERQIILSSEHIKSQIFNLNSAGHKIKHRDKVNFLNVIKSRFLKISEERARKIELKIKLQNICNSLQQKYSKKYEIIISGSIARDEFNSKFSDLDLIIYSKQQIIEKEIIHSEILNKLQTNNFNNGLGITFLTKGDRVNLLDPLWSYFSNNQIVKIKKQTDLIWISEKLNDGYELFRIIWYRFLRSYIGDIDYDDYEFCKGMLFIESFISSEDQFVGYDEIKSTIFNRLIDNGNNSNHLIRTLEAVDYKLGLREDLNFSPRIQFLDTASSILHTSDNSTSENIISSFLIEMNSSKLRNNDFLNSLIINVLGKRYEQIFIKAIREKVYSTIWIVLIRLRLTIWPEQVKHSYFKYMRYLRILDKKSTLELEGKKAPNNI